MVILQVIWFVYFSLIDRKLAQVGADGYKVTIQGKTTWDNYCLPHKIIIEKLHSGIKNTFKLDAEPERPCRLAQPWIKVIDVNGDGYKDIQLLNMAIPLEKNAKQSVYKTFVFVPNNLFFAAE